MRGNRREANACKSLRRETAESNDEKIAVAGGWPSSKAPVTFLIKSPATRRVAVNASLAARDGANSPNI